MDPAFILPAIGFAFTVMTFLGGLVFQAGRLSARVDQLDAARAERRGDLAQLLERFDRIEVRLARLEGDS